MACIFDLHMHSIKVNMGYLSKVPGITSITKVNQPRWTSVVRKIHQWIYSWMKPGYVEDEEEYIIF